MDSDLSNNENSNIIQINNIFELRYVRKNIQVIKTTVNYKIYDVISKKKKLNHVTELNGSEGSHIWKKNHFIHILTNYHSIKFNREIQ